MDYQPLVSFLYHDKGVSSFIQGFHHHLVEILEQN